MREHLSIFSFDTLRLRPHLPLAFLASLLVFGACNLWAGRELRAHRLFTSVPRDMIDGAVSDMKRAQGTWFIGNSTLAEGVDEKQLSSMMNQYAKVALGSATFESMVALAELGLAGARRAPRRIVFVVSKDDLNAHGSRAEKSRSYVAAMHAPTWRDRLISALPWYGCRYAIKNRIVAALMRLVGPGKRAPVSKQKQASIQYRSLAAEIDTTYLYNLGHDYEPLIPSLRALRAQAGNNIEIWLVLPPVTTAIAAWQARFAPKYPWSSVRDSLRTAAEEQGFRVADYTDLYPSTTEYFRDTYHLSKAGSQAWTRRLLDDLSRTQGITGAHTQDNRADTRRCGTPVDKADRTTRFMQDTQSANGNCMHGSGGYDLYALRSVQLFEPFLNEGKNDDPRYAAERDVLSKER